MHTRVRAHIHIVQRFRRTLISSAKFPDCDFSSARKAFQHKSFVDLFVGQFVFRSCQIKPLVEHSEAMIDWSYKLLGTTMTDFLLKPYSAHFTAGTDAEDIEERVKRLTGLGVGIMLDYAAEADVKQDKKQPKSEETNREKSVNEPVWFDMTIEEDCEKHKKTFLESVTAVSKTAPGGFAAIKVTALCNPELLKRTAALLCEARDVFKAMDPTKTGFVDRNVFLAHFNRPVAGSDASDLFDKLDHNYDGKVSYVEWTNMGVAELVDLAAHSQPADGMAKAALTQRELVHHATMTGRVEAIAMEAAKLGVKLMIDAEHTYVQAAIDSATLDLQRRYNQLGNQSPIVWGTYQMYLQDGAERLILDLERARGKFKIGWKFVRGAYLDLERPAYLKRDRPDPFNADMEATHKMYDDAVRMMIARLAAGEDFEFMVATHNEHSVVQTLAAMKTHGLTPQSGVYFGQLYGMMDHITFELADKGFKVVKYTPYGPVREVVKYLGRRARENGSALGGAKKEVSMLNGEMRSRMGLGQEPAAPWGEPNIAT